MTLARPAASVTRPPQLSGALLARLQAGPDRADMAEGRVFVEPRGTARELWGRCGLHAAAPRGDGGTWSHGARRVSRAFFFRLSPASRAGLLNAIPMATPLRRSGTPREPRGPHGTPGGCGAGSGGPLRELSAAAGSRGRPGGFLDCPRCWDGGGSNPSP